MPEWHALSPKTHGALGWQPFTHYGFTSKDSVAPMLAAEISQAIGCLPIAFIRSSSGTYQLVAVLSLRPGKNEFVDTDGRWKGRYVPAIFRGHPFQLKSHPNKADQLLLCIDRKSEWVHDPAHSGDQPIFTAEGELSGRVKEVLAFLQRCQQDQKRTERLVAQLEQHGLIKPWLLQKSADSKGQGLMLHHIKEKDMQSLSGDTLHALSKTGALTLAYSQIMGQARLQEMLGDNYDAKNMAPDNLDSFFDDDDEDFHFDFN